MHISVKIPSSTSEECFARVVALAEYLPKNDATFTGFSIQVERWEGDETHVRDPVDPLREHLLHILVAEALGAELGSTFGGLF